MLLRRWSPVGIVACLATIQLSGCAASAQSGSKQLHPCHEMQTASGSLAAVRPWFIDSAATPASLFGRLYSVEGKPLSMVLAGLTHENGARHSAFSDSLGRFTISAIEPGKYELIFMSIELHKQTHEFVALSGANDTMCVVLRAKPIALPEIDTFNGR